MLYARAIHLRTCGRLTIVESDFGADYRTFTHVSSEALYASLTRGATWRPHVISIKNDPVSFALAYDVQSLPLWFVPSVFSIEEGDLDRSSWNVVHEFYPTTSRSYLIKNGEVVEKDDTPHHVPTYGTIEAILPNRRFSTYAFSADHSLLDAFRLDQTFLLGKKRSMVQIMDLSPVVEGTEHVDICHTGWLELPPNYGNRFQRLEVAAVTLRHLIIRGMTREEGRFTEFSFGEVPFILPQFYLDQLPLAFS